MSAHTQGIMKTGVSKVFGSNAFTAVPEGNESKIVAVFGFCGAPDEAESIANAKRFCAAWNSCEGLDPDHLARFGLGTASGSEIFKLREQRDELIEALRHIEGAAMDIACDRRTIREAAKAAMANATKGAP